MNPRGRHPLLVLAAGIASVLAAASARADAPPPPPTPGYADRVIGAANLQALPPDDDDAPGDGTGLPRSYRVDLDLSRNQRGDQTFDEQAISASGFWETADLGSFSLDANLFHADRNRRDGTAGFGGAATLWQRNLYLDGGWHGDNGLGVLNTLSLPLQRSQYRFYLPTVPFAGLGSEWVNDGNGLRVQASIGRAGLYTGTRITGFDVANGDVAALGAQWSWAPRWTGAAAFLGTHGRIAPDGFGNAVLKPSDTRALYAATAWEGARERWQLNLLSSNGDRGSAIGAWLDGNATRGRYTHRFGLFRLDPGLAWGALPINNDAEGAYYRATYQYGRWSWNGGIDQIHSLSGNSFDGSYANAFARYQSSSSLGYGGSLSVRRSGEVDYNAEVFADKRSHWGQTRVQLDRAGGGNGGHSWLLSVDQSFPLQQGARLSTSVTYGALHYAGRASTRTSSLALYGGRDLGDRLSFDGSARWLREAGPAATHGLDLNLGLNWRLARGWSLAANVYQNQGSQRSPFVLDPLATDTPFVGMPRDRSAFLTLRYEHHAGLTPPVLGALPGGPVGSVTGNIFLDDNDDGIRAASELVAPNLTVVLDGRYSVRTDERGNFEFARVAAGSHVLSVVPDNLPLPWFIADSAAQRTVVVGVRRDVHIDIGARRPR